MDKHDIFVKKISLEKRKNNETRNKLNKGNKKDHKHMEA